VVGIVQKLSVPPLLLVVMLMTNDGSVVDRRVNSLPTNTLGWITTLVALRGCGLSHGPGDRQLGVGGWDMGQ
jgi:hypothetical protein